jgi:RimJ/RimL family protein N-acetyltransferase
MTEGERHTGRLLARPPADADRAAYHSHFAEPEVERWLRPAPLTPFDAATIDRLLRDDREHWEEHGFGPWALFDAESGEFAGRGGLAFSTVERRLAVELPWSIRPTMQGRGLATEAALAAVSQAHQLGFEEVLALVMPANVPSRRVAEKAGFEAAGSCEHAGFPHLLFRLRLA